MKLGLQIFSWVAVVIGVLASISGLSQISADPTSAYYSLLGGALFATQGVLSLIYVNQHK
jgi:hypothetical protein